MFTNERAYVFKTVIVRHSNYNAFDRQSATLYWLLTHFVSINPKVFEIWRNILYESYLINCTISRKP